DFLAFERILRDNEPWLLVHTDRQIQSRGCSLRFPKQRLQRGLQGGHSLAKHLYWPARDLAHEWAHVLILWQFRNRRYIVEHCWWFGRLQRGRQGGDPLAKHLHWPARNLDHEWYH